MSDVDQALVGDFHPIQTAGGCEIQTEAQFNHGASDKRLRDIGCPASRCILSKLEPTICFPEVDAGAEPIVIIVAGFEGCPGQQSLTDATVAAVVAEDEGGGEAMQGD